MGQSSARTGLQVVVLELPARWNAVDQALDDLAAALSEARGALVVVPELAFTGYLSPRGESDLARFAEPLDGPTIAKVASLARAHDAHLVVPLVLREGDAISNASVLVGPSGDVVATYRKRHPWIPERWATPGTRPPPVVDVRGVQVTFGICYDLHFLPDDAASELHGADLLVFTSAWVDEDATRLPQLAALSAEFRVAVANANWGKGVLEIPGQGDSVIFDASGAQVARVGPNERRAEAFVPALKKAKPAL